MTAVEPSAGVLAVAMEKVTGSTFAGLTDTLSVEEPLEIRLTADIAERRSSRVVAITMRTPGDDCDLAAGFLFTEGIVSDADEFEDIDSENQNVVSVTLRRGVEVDLTLLERHSFVASSCGVCGKKSIAAVCVRRKFPIAAGERLRSRRHRSGHEGRPGPDQRQCAFGGDCRDFDPT